MLKTLRNWEEEEEEEEEEEDEQETSNEDLCALWKGENARLLYAEPEQSHGIFLLVP